MNGLLSICLLLGLLSPVASLRCKACFGCSDACSDENTVIVECGQDEDVCIVTSADVGAAGFPLNFTYKGCGKSNGCSLSHASSVTVGGSIGVMINHCCHTDECNVGNLPVERNLQPNGMQCSACVSAGEETCNSQGTTIHCLGNQTQCMETTFDISVFGLPSRRIAIHGCANQELCSLLSIPSSQFANGLMKTTVANWNCQSAKPSY